MQARLQQECESHGYTLALTNLIYQAEKVKVYEARDASTSQLYVVKLLTFPTLYSYEKATNEIAIVWKLSHPNVIKCFGYFWYTSSQQTWELVIIFEKMPKDLMKEIKDRSQQQYMWTEEELMTLFGQMVSAFSFMQLQGIAHRDIKPQNILIDKLVLKVTDFGTSKEVLYQTVTQSVAGTPYYLSPKLKQGLQARLEKVPHNAFRSDVYSLGLTFLTMAKLEPPMNMAQFKSLARTTEQEICSLIYSDQIKNLLRYMLQVDEQNRVDFIQLNQYFESMKEAPAVQVHSPPPLETAISCVHVTQGYQAVIQMPCHGYLCIECVHVVQQNADTWRYVCKYCNSYDTQVVSDPQIQFQDNPEVPVEELKQPVPPVLKPPEQTHLDLNKNTKMESELKELTEPVPMVCTDCKAKLNRADLVPGVGTPKLLCKLCQETYEIYYGQKFGAENKKS